MNFRALLNTFGNTSRTLPILILYVTEGCNLKCLTCSYRDPLPDELTLSEIEELADGLSRFGLRHVVYSGGEPLVRRDFKKICEIFKRQNVKQSLLTNGLLLEKLIDDIRRYFSEIIVSIDGADEHTHNTIRGVNSFAQIVKGITKTTSTLPRPKISIRTVVQKRNFSQIDNIVELGKSLGVDRVSFLAADVHSQGFGRETRGSITTDETILLSESEVTLFRSIIEQMIKERKDDFNSGFISESPSKLLHIVQYFEAMLGRAPFPRNYCNAPNVSAVITSTGEFKPCYFLPSVGNIRDTDFHEIVNNDILRSTRKEVRKWNLDQCKRCVCTLSISPLAALADKF